MECSAEVVVLGAGPAGLAAAWRAARRGLSVTVLERAPVVGGLAGSFEIAGVRVDHGSHRLHPATPPELYADLHRLLGDDLQTRRRNGRLHFAGRWVGFPLRPAELARSVPPGMLSRVAAETAASPLRRPRTDTYAEQLRSGLGPTLYEALYAPYAEKLWGLSGDRIAGEQARKRVTADTPWKIAGRMLRGHLGARVKGQSSGRGRGQGRIFHYPRRGYGQLAEALADAATADGARIRTGIAVEELLLHDGVGITTATGEELTAGHVLSTVPLTALAAMTHPAPPLAAVEAAGRLRFRAMVLVYLVHDGGRWTPYDAHYLPDARTPVTRISEPANYRDSRDDPPGRSVLCFEIPCAVGDALWEADDEALRELAERTVRETGLPGLRVAGTVVRRLRHVYPVYEVGFEDSFRGLDDWATSLPGVTTLGRLGLFSHDNSHHALAMGYAAADAMGGEGFDRAAWSSARERFAEHAVED